MMVSIHGPDDSEFDFRTAMNIWGKLIKRHILVEKAKESTDFMLLLTTAILFYFQHVSDSLNSSFSWNFP
jgi:hypothetical protein